MDYTVTITQGLEENSGAKEIRQMVFVEEQGFEHEFDEIDAGAFHLLMQADQALVATGRTFPSGRKGVWIIGRVAVMPEFRARSLGRQVIERLEETARQHGATQMELSAQSRARGFYEKLGYTATGEEYLDEFCPHLTMRKTLC